MHFAVLLAVFESACLWRTACSLTMFFGAILLTARAIYLLRAHILICCKCAAAFFFCCAAFSDILFTGLYALLLVLRVYLQAVLTFICLGYARHMPFV